MCDGIDICLRCNGTSEETNHGRFTPCSIYPQPEPSDPCSFLFTRRTRRLFLVPTILWLRPVKRETEGRISLPCFERLKKSCAPVESFVERVVIRTINESDELRIPWLNEAIFNCVLNECPNWLKVSPNVGEHNGYVKLSWLHQ